MSASALKAPIATATPQKTEWELRCELAAVYRLLDHYRMTDLIFTHVSVRLPGPEHHFLINPYGLMFDEITASRLVKIGLDGELVEPSEYRVNPAGFVIHGAVHAAREDAQCVLHTHTRSGCAVAAQEHGLLPVNQVSLEFYNRVGYHDYEGIALNTAERERLVADLGPHHALILRNHGLLTVGQSAADAFLRMFYLDRACEIQVAALSSGALRLPDPAVAEHTAQQFAGEASDELSDDDAYPMAWAALLRRLDRIAPDYRD